ncbi:uncharacterized protein PAC_17680 [Phialocephala subalpina]|uniref:Uncharacterized protein n=1 Tax=Phialocephala subalpina TaxID=576137 RepID=A0A1L7XRU8_9HELO|nr:uncharacterized protein PAC_17680 [Phialocephala subalpina]
MSAHARLIVDGTNRGSSALSLVCDKSLRDATPGSREDVDSEGSFYRERQRNRAHEWRAFHTNHNENTFSRPPPQCSEGKPLRRLTKDVRSTYSDAYKRLKTRRDRWRRLKSPPTNPTPTTQDQCGSFKEYEASEKEGGEISMSNLLQLRRQTPRPRLPWQAKEGQEVKQEVDPKLGSDHIERRVRRYCYSHHIRIHESKISEQNTREINTTRVHSIVTHTCCSGERAESRRFLSDGLATSLPEAVLKKQRARRLRAQGTTPRKERTAWHLPTSGSIQQPHTSTREGS